MPNSNDTATKGEATAIPWRLLDSGNHTYVIPGVAYGIIGKANARLIVKAVNSHDALRASLNELFAWIEMRKADFIGNTITSADYEAMMKPAAKAIAEAEKG